MNEIYLKKLHEEYGATFGEFAGWSVPMVFKSTVDEHIAVRNSCGVFDISHMGRIRVSGPDSLKLLERAFTKRIEKTKEGFLSGPTLALNEHARVIDDEMWYKVSDTEWLGVPNAAARERIINHLREIASSEKFNVNIEDLTFDYVMLAVQGPKSPEVLEKALSVNVKELKQLQFLIGSVKDVFLLSRSGWTGEDGFELWIENEKAPAIFKRIVEAGAKPVGIIARDTLRMEMGFVLGGNEYGEDPIEFPCAIALRYGMGSIDWDKRGFVGESALRACRKEGLRWVRYGFVMKKDYARFIPRKGYKIYVDDVQVGWITSGTYSPILSRGIGQGYIDVRYAIPGETVTIIGERSREAVAKIEDFPLLKK